MKKSIALLLLGAAFLPAQTRVCQKYDKAAHTFVDRPCPVQKASKMRTFWSKVGRDTRETLEVTGMVLLVGGLVYVEAIGSSNGGGPAALSPAARK